MLASCCVLWMDNWYRAQYTTHPDESDWSQDCSAMALLQLKRTPTYGAGHPAIEEDLAARITTVGRALQQRERRIPHTLRDMGYADGCVPDTRNVRAPLDVRRDTRTVRAPLWRPLALSQEKVTGCVGLLHLLHFAKDTAQQTNRVLPLLVDENIHYRILKFLYGARNQRWNMRAYVRYVPVLYGVWHAYKFVVTHTFRVFAATLAVTDTHCARPRALNDTKRRSVMRCECVRPGVLSRLLSPVELVTAKTVVEQICEDDLQNAVSTDFRVQMTAFHVMPSALFRCFLAS